MIGYNGYKASPILLDKMINLCSLLMREKKEFEQVATTVTNKNLRYTVLTLAQESNQYAHELCSQIYSLGGIPEIEKIKEPGVQDEIKNFNDDNDILTLCKMNEKKMIDAYREILNESFLYED